MKQSERIKKGCMLSPKKRRVRAIIDQGDGLPRLKGDFDHPRSSRLEEGKTVVIRGLSHALPIMSYGIEGRSEYVTLRGTEDDVERLARKERWQLIA